MPYCSACGSAIADNASFCPKCGRSVAQATGTGAAAVPAATSGLQENIAGALAYLVVTAVIFLVIDTYNRNRFIRFHSFQAIALFFLSIAVQAILHLIPIIGWALIPVAGVVFFFVWIFAMLKAFQHEMYKLPFIGDWASRMSSDTKY